MGDTGRKLKALPQDQFVKEDKVDKCFRCRVSFRGKKKYHCHVCGKVYCIGCCGSKVNIDGVQKPQRVCLDCLTPTGSVADTLKRVYERKMLPIEQACMYEDFFSPCLRGADFDAKPMVLLIGQYSVGKTSFIQFVIEKSFLNARIGPEPTTDCYHVVTYGQNERLIPGSALSVQKDRPFYALEKFGTNFLTKLECSETNAEMLKNITFVDTPGILSGEKQRLGRGYDFVGVCGWFIEKADVILLLFDAHKLDISDEFKEVIDKLRGHEEKIKVVLNKSDSITSQQLIKVNGALMWSLGKIFKTPESMRVYTGSFWSHPCQNMELKDLFEREEADLIRDLMDLPRNSMVRKVNSLVKRARNCRVHAHILSYLREQSKGMFGKDKKQKQLIENLADVFNEVRKLYKFPIGDFPPIAEYQAVLSNDALDFSKFPKLGDIAMQSLEEVLNVDLPAIVMQATPIEGEQAPEEEDINPFQDINGWVVTEADKKQADVRFSEFHPIGGKVSGKVLRPWMVESGLGHNQLKQVWELSDVDKDGKLDEDEFALCWWLIEQCKIDSGYAIPESLPVTYCPPSKRH